MNAIVERCEVCGALVDLEDLFCANCGTEVPDHRRDQPTRLAINARNFQCRGCGASMNYDAAAQSLKCPFCGSVDLAEEGGKGILAPEFVIPFAIDQAEAEDRLRTWLGSSFWHPNDLRTAAQVTELRRVCVPFWVFTTVVQTYWTADSSRTPAGARAGWFPVSGRSDREYANLWVPAGDAISLGELNAILPFDVKSAAPPDQGDLADLTVEQFSVSRRYARPLAQGRLEAMEAQAVAQVVPGSTRNVHVNLLMENATSRPALVPIYVMAYRYRDRVFRYVLNGQTGRFVGRAPTSAAKVAGVFGIIVLVILIVLAVAVLAHG